MVADSYQESWNAVILHTIYEMYCTKILLKWSTLKSRADHSFTTIRHFQVRCVCTLCTTCCQSNRKVSWHLCHYDDSGINCRSALMTVCWCAKPDATVVQPTDRAHKAEAAETNSIRSGEREVAMAQAGDFCRATFNV